MRSRPQSRRTRHDASAFRRGMAKHWIRRQEHLNRQFRRCLEETANSTAASPSPSNHLPPECSDLWAHCDYQRESQENYYRFGLGEGRVCAFGRDDCQQLGQPSHTILDEGLKKNTYGPLFVTIKDETSQPIGANVRQVSAGGQHSMALSNDGVPYTWGTSDEGVLGRDIQRDHEGDITLSEATPTAVTTFKTVDGIGEAGMIAEIAAGESFSLFRSIAGNVYISGFFKEEDSLKVRNTPSPSESPLDANHQHPVHVPLPGKAVRIYTGGDAKYCAAQLEDGRLFTWGMGQKGQLARSRNMREPGPDGKYDLGRSWYISVVNDKRVIDEAILKEKFMLPGEVLFDYPTNKIKVISAACGSMHFLVVGRPSDRGGHSLVFGAGFNSCGQLGFPVPESEEAEIEEIHQLTEIPALTGKEIVKVAAGGMHSLALDITGVYIYAWGRAADGELGGGYELTKTKTRHVPHVVTFPQVEGTTLPVQRIFRDIYAGDRASIAITVDDEIFSWGFGENQATGHEVADGEDVYWARQLNLEQSLTGAGQKGKVKFDILDASVGNTHSLLLLKELVDS